MRDGANAAIVMCDHNDAGYEALLNDLIHEVFGFSFDAWHKLGVWDARYESYAVMDDGAMLANVCLFKTELHIGGARVVAHQYGAVATRKAHRGRGLSARIMAHIGAKYPAVPAFLFANPSVIDFYPRFGFRRAVECGQVVDVCIDNPARPVTLSPADPRVRRALDGRGALSSVLDCINTQPVQLFHLLMDYPNAIYDLGACGAVVVAEQDGDTLFLADVIAARPISFDELCRHLPFTGVRRVKFGFNADWLGVSGGWQPIENSLLFVRGDMPLPDRFAFPCMSQT